MQVNKRELWVFFKKYGYIFVMGIILMITSIVLALTLSGNETPTEPVDNDPITMYSPIISATLTKGYTDKTLLYNSTLKQWEAHKALTFAVGANADVFAVLDGVVKDVYTSYLEGTVIVLEHSGNLTSTYKSLANDVTLKKGDNVTRGDKIGVASNTANSELLLGNHLRFELRENGNTIDPSSYLNLSNK